MPVINLWPEAIATGDALAYADRHGATDLEREEYRILYPAYGANIGGVAGDLFAGAFLPVYAGSVVAGHMVGRWESGRIDDSSDDLSASAGDTTSQTVLQADIDRLPINDSSDPEATSDDAAILIATAATPPR